MVNAHHYKIDIETRVDIPDDVIVEHISHALRQIVDPEKRRANRAKVNVTLVEHRKPRSHPFEGPVVNDDWDDNVIFSGKREEGWEDTGIKGVLPEVSIEDQDVLEVDLSEIMPAIITAITQDFPRLAELFEDKRQEAHEVRRNATITDPPAEGDWELPVDDNVGDDL